MSRSDAPCDHKGSLEFIETSLMADMTMETVVLCGKCKKQMIIKGEKFTSINDDVYKMMANRLGSKTNR